MDERSVVASEVTFWDTHSFRRAECVRANAEILSAHRGGRNAGDASCAPPEPAACQNASRRPKRNCRWS